MAIEQVTVTGAQATKSGKGMGFKLDNGEMVFSFDAPVIAHLQQSIGKTVSVDVRRKENAQGNTFATVLSFHGESAGGDPSNAPAPQAPAASPNVTEGSPRTGAGPRGDFKKDPVGIVLGSRQTALNAAVAACGDVAFEEIISAAQQFNEFLLAGLSDAVLRDGLTAKNVMPWKT